MCVIGGVQAYLCYVHVDVLVRVGITIVLVQSRSSPVARKGDFHYSLDERTMTEDAQRC